MGNNRAGRQSVLNRLSELLFVEVIRWHMDRLANSSNTGWLAGLRDPLIGRALTLPHARPAHAWTRSLRHKSARHARRLPISLPIWWAVRRFSI
jgi:hypothetical protein